MNSQWKGDHLFLVLWKAWRSIERFDRASIEAQGFGCLSDFAVLEVLRSKGALTVSEVGERILLTSGSVTSAVQRLEKKGWISRSRDPDDGRVVRVDLTAEGRAVIDHAFTEHAARLDSLFGIFTQEERAQFHQLVRKIGRHAESMNQ